MKRKLLSLKAFLIAFLFLMHFLHPVGTNAQPNSGLVKGMVTGINGEPLVDVSVLVRNSKTNFASGTKTDTAGVFTTRVPSGGPYSFSFTMVGYEPQTLSGYNIKEGSTFNLVVEMKTSSASLDQ